MSKVPSDRADESASAPVAPLLAGDAEPVVQGAPEYRSERYKALSAKHLGEIPQLAKLSDDDRFAMRVVANVLPFRSNRYVIDNLIDWDRVPDDPIYQLTFPQQGMLKEADFAQMADLMRREASASEIKACATEIRDRLNPHPAGQRELNIPQSGDGSLEGIQHKYRETVLFFPVRGRPVTPIAPSASAGPSSWATTPSRSWPRKPTAFTITWPRILTSPTSW